MKSLNPTSTQALTYGVPATILLISIILASGPWVLQHPELATGITYDLTLTAPLAYWLLIRKRAISIITVVPLFLIGVLLATLLLPASQRQHLDFIKTFALPVVELVVIATLGRKVVKGLRKAKAQANPTMDFYQILQTASLELLKNPRLAKVLATEIAMLYYGLVIWKKKKPAPHEYTYHRTSGSVAIFYTLLLILFIETLALHLVAERWSPLLAWFLTISSVYAALQVLGHIKAMSRRFYRVGSKYLQLNYGLFGDLVVDLREIDQVEKSGRETDGGGRKVEHLSLLKQLEPHNVILYFNTPQTITGVYGFSRTCEVLSLYIDQPEAFVTHLQAALK